MCPKSGEITEKKDRAEDAFLSVKAARGFGAIPAGGHTLVKLAADFTVQASNLPINNKRIALEVLSEALLEPVRMLYKNYGYTKEEIEIQLVELLKRENETYDILEQQWVGKYDILDTVLP